MQEAGRKRNEDMQEMRRQMTQLKTAQDQQIQGLTKEMQEASQHLPTIYNKK